MTEDTSELAGLERRPPYQMRHIFATLALAQGVPIESIARQLGYTDIRTTLLYYARFVKAVDDRMRALLDQLGSDGHISDTHAESGQTE